MHHFTQIRGNPREPAFLRVTAGPALTSVPRFLAWKAIASWTCRSQ